jgi:2-phospho-L-lactate transferase/gluconeogenesis factor (CofD/UPF0052 family)
MGIKPSAASVAEHYGSKDGGGLLSGFVFDILDTDEQAAIKQPGLPILITNSIMKNDQDRVTLASEVINFGKSLVQQ